MRFGERPASFLFLFLILLSAIFPPQGSVLAASTLTVTPVTWNIIGLDSNSPTSGPYRFPVGARVCNTSGSSTTATVNFVWDDGGGTFWGDPGADTYINLRTGSYSSISLSIAANSCADAYFEAEVSQVAGAYDKTRTYHITATDGSGTASSSIPRELYIEHLISQSRNSITNVKYGPNSASLTSVAPGGSMSLVVGNTYTIELDGGTATQGYNQFEAFINFPNTIFQILSVNTSYSADNSPYVSNPNDKLYADACKWENNPGSAYYRSCIGGDYKAGGNTVVTTYTIKIIGGGGTTQTLNTLLYDFSGSSYHYNSDFSAGGRIAYIIDPTNVTISKNFSPNPANVNGISALTITISNPNGAAISGYNFTDPLPSNMKVASTPGASTSGCGTPTFSPAANDTMLTFSNGTIAANSSCVIKVNITTTATGPYTNTTNHLYIDSLDTTKFATAGLTVNSAASTGTGICGTATLATWALTGLSGTTTTPAYTSKASNVSSATASYTGTGTSAIDATNGNAAPSWGVTDGWAQNNTGYPNAASPYFLFHLDTTNYTAVSIALDFHAYQNWANSSDNHLYIYSSSTSDTTGSYTNINDTSNFSKNDAAWTHVTASASATGSTDTYFRINAVGEQSNSAQMDLDNITFTGTTCGPAIQPTISKVFSPNPIAVNGVSTLTFTLTNTNTTALTGAKFTDSLPSGVQVAATPSASTTCTGSPTWAPAANDTTLNFGQTTGATIPASGSCTVSVNVTATTSGAHNNVSGFLSTTESGTNTSSLASASLTAILPPSISKVFDPSTIAPGGTSTLTFVISNPNSDNSLSGVTFSDTLPTSPASMVVASTPGATTTNCGAPTFSPTAGSGSISFSNGTIAAGGTCTVKVNVTAPSAGTYNNTSGAVSATTAGTGNTASASLTVAAHPAISILKQVGATSSGSWYSFLPVSSGTNVYYQFTIENPGDVTLTSISVSDPTLTGLGVNLSGCSTASLTAYSSYTCVVGPVSASVVSGLHTNTATVSGTYSGTQTDSSSASYYTTTLNLSKTVTETSFKLGDTLHYSYAVTNPTASVPLLGPVTVTDDKTTVTCPALSTIGNGDDYLDFGETLTCTATYTAVAADVTAKSITNNATAKIGGITSNTSSQTVPLQPDLTLTKSNDVSGTVGIGSTFHWTLTGTNSSSAGAASFSNGQTILIDDLPTTGATYSASSSATNGAGTTGIIDCSITSNTLTCTANGTVTIASGGAFSESITVTPTAVGSLANPKTGGTCKIDSSSLITELDETNNTCSTNTVTVTKATPTLTTTASGPVTVGSNITDTAHLSGGYGSLSGTITFDVYAPGDTACATPLTAPTGATVAGVGDYPSGNFTTAAAGSYRWIAHYSGDANNNAVNTACNDTNETSTVDQATPTISTQLKLVSDNTNLANPIVTGTALYDTASLTSGYNASGTVTYKIYSNNICTSLVQDVTPGTNTVSSGLIPNSASYTFNTAGNFWYQAVYSGDTNNNSATSLCTSEPVVVVGIDAVNDSGLTVDGASGGTSLANVLTNDSLNGTSPVLIAEVNLTQVSTTNAGVTLNTADGSVNVAAGTAAGTYTVTYQICDKLNPTVCDTATVSVPVSILFDPPSAFKSFNAAGLPEITFRMVWINNSNSAAVDVQVTDDIPTGTTYVAGSITCTPRGSSSTAASADTPLSSTAVPNSACGYDATGNLIQWQGTIGPDPGVTNDANSETNANNEVVITFRVTVDDGTNEVENRAFSYTDRNSNNSFADETSQAASFAASNLVVWNRTSSGNGGGDPAIQLPKTLPATGFAPNISTIIPQQPANLAYEQSDVTIEIPRMGVKLPVVGIPLVNGKWDVSWLVNQAGWLSGTSFPTWNGNSVLTSHVYLANGNPGPFVNLGTLKYGDKIIVHAYGDAYIYEVRVSKVVSPDDTSVLGHKDESWLTLITCKSYDQSKNTYENRTVVQAVLLSVGKDAIPNPNPADPRRE